MKLLLDTSSDAQLNQEINPPQISILTLPQSNDIPLSTTLFYDSTLKEVNTDELWNNYTVTFPNVEEIPTLINKSPSIYSIDNNLLSRISDGMGLLQYDLNGVKKQNRLNFNFIPSSTYQEFLNFAEGTLSKFLLDQIKNRLTPLSETKYYSTVDHTTNTFIKNPNCWAYDIDLSGVAIASDREVAAPWTPSPRAILITPQHVLGVRHYPIYQPIPESNAGYGIGTKLKFADGAGNTYIKSVIGRAYWEDVIVATLDSELPSNIVPIAICGEWFQRNIGVGPTAYCGGCGFHLQQSYNCFITYTGNTLTTLTYSPTAAYTINGNLYANTFISSQVVDTFYYTNAPHNPLSGYPSFYKYGYGGDSGSPFMILSGNTPMLLHAWTGSHAGYPLWNGNGDFVRDLISVADADAISNGFIASPTGKLITVAEEPVY